MYCAEPFFLVINLPIFLDTSLVQSYTSTLGSRQVNMRRRPLNSCGTSSIRRVAPPVGLNFVLISDVPAFLDDSLTNRQASRQLNHAQDAAGFSFANFS